MRKFELNVPSGGPFSRMFGRRCAAFVDRTRRVDPKIAGFFRKIDKDSGGSVS